MASGSSSAPKEDHPVVFRLIFSVSLPKTDEGPSMRDLYMDLVTSHWETTGTRESQRKGLRSEVTK